MMTMSDKSPCALINFQRSEVNVNLKMNIAPNPDSPSCSINCHDKPFRRHQRVIKKRFGVLAFILIKVFVLNVIIKQLEYLEVVDRKALTKIKDECYPKKSPRSNLCTNLKLFN